MMFIIFYISMTIYDHKITDKDFYVTPAHLRVFLRQLRVA